MLFLQAICCLAAAFSYVESKGNSPKDWQSYKALYHKFYANSVSETVHKQNFNRNLQRVETNNAKYEAGNVTYILAINKFSDMDPETFSKTMTGYNPMMDLNTTAEPAPVYSQIGTLAANLDWRSDGKVSPVKNQKNCGSCWTFAATGAVESQMLIKGKSLTTLSEQQLVDCDKGSNGCNGGSFYGAFEYIKRNGIQSDRDYPYKAAKGSCKFSNSKVVTRVSGIYKVASDANQIMQTLKKVGPLAISLNGKAIQQYKRGVFKCSDHKLGHAVLLVGYGSENGEDYWLVKNSWGTDWGEKGYIKISRKSANDCGITTRPAYATI